MRVPDNWQIEPLVSRDDVEKFVALIRDNAESRGHAMAVMVNIVGNMIADDSKSFLDAGQTLYSAKNIMSNVIMLRYLADNAETKQ